MIAKREGGEEFNRGSPPIVRSATDARSEGSCPGTRIAPTGNMRTATIAIVATARSDRYKNRGPPFVFLGWVRATEGRLWKHSYIVLLPVKSEVHRFHRPVRACPSRPRRRTGPRRTSLCRRQ